VPESRVNLISAIIAAGILAGCGAPQPPKPVNARLKDDSPYSLLRGRQPVGEADVGILARCSQLMEYAKTTKGNWETHWYFANWEILKVTDGNWQYQNLRFIYNFRSPTPESGIVVSMLPFPKDLGYEGLVSQFSLDTSTDLLPLIVDVESRSLIAPHEPLKGPSWDLNNPRDNERRVQVLKAAKEFMNKPHFGGLVVFEEFDDFFVVEHHFDLKCEALTVDKDTYEVRRVDSASPK
jgi:hypothetical protein